MYCLTQKYTGGYILPKNRMQNYTGGIISQVGIFLPVTPAAKEKHTEIYNFMTLV